MKRFYFVQYHGETPSAILELEKPLDYGFFSHSRGYDTEAELREKHQLQPEGCSCCGQPYGVNYVEERKQRLLAAGICFTCDFWKEIIQGPPGLRIKGHHYRALPDTPRPKVGSWEPGAVKTIEINDRFAGHGGREFHIRRLDTCETFTSRNLWHQGAIPARFKDQLPDNAEFVEIPAATGPGYFASH